MPARSAHQTVPAFRVVRAPDCRDAVAVALAAALRLPAQWAALRPYDPGPQKLYYRALMPLARPMSADVQRVSLDLRAARPVVVAVEAPATVPVARHVVHGQDFPDWSAAAEALRSLVRAEREAQPPYDQAPRRVCCRVFRHREWRTLLDAIQVPQLLVLVVLAHHPPLPEVRAVP